MRHVRALLVDLEGTACLQDVSELLLDAFGGAAWERFDQAVDLGADVPMPGPAGGPRCPGWRTA